MRRLILGSMILVLVAVLAIPAIAAACEDCTPPPATNDQITLTGTIRDFKYSGNPSGNDHPDFGVQPANGFALRTGLVQSILGSDGTPDLNPNYASQHSGRTTWQDAAIKDAASFKEWYSANSYNQSMPYNMIFTEKAPGSEVYVFSATPFYPIDGQLCGNEGNIHNYHFTLQLHTDFTYQQMQGRTLQFFSDDDLWIFIDGQLVLDLGGVHAQTPGSVAFDGLGLSEGPHTFDLFFAERHTVDSQFCATAPTPEIATGVLLIIGVAALGGLVWVRRRKAGETIA